MEHENLIWTVMGLQSKLQSMEQQVKDARKDLVDVQTRAKNYAGALIEVKASVDFLLDTVNRSLLF